MSEPFLAEIKMVGFNFPPRGWALCDGQILPINQNQSLFSLMGTTYGGDGRTSFALPDMRGRTPVHVGTGVTLGQKAGAEQHILSAAQMPKHTHVAQASTSNADLPTPGGVVLAAANNLYGAERNMVKLRSETVTNSGGGQAHNNMQPFLALNFCIALQGLFPPRN